MTPRDEGLVARIVKSTMTWERISKRSAAGLLAIAALFATTVPADAPDYQHGISLLHELKYPADFEHFDYADPDAPKGGAVHLSTTSPVRNFLRRAGRRGTERCRSRTNGRPAVDPVGR